MHYRRHASQDPGSAAVGVSGKHLNRNYKDNSIKMSLPPWSQLGQSSNSSGVKSKRADTHHRLSSRVSTCLRDCIFKRLRHCLSVI